MKILEIVRADTGAVIAESGGWRSRMWRHDRRGSVLIVVAIAGMALVCVVSLVVDVGMLLLAHREAQRAADSAALAGASAFIQFDPLDTLTSGTAYDSARARAYDYAERHTMLHDTIVASEVTPQILLDSQRVRVTVRRPAIPTIFARLFGINTAGVSATAVAEAVQAGQATKCVKPFAIPDMWNDADQDTLSVAPSYKHNHIWEFEQTNKNNAVENWYYDPTQGDTYTPADPGVPGSGTGYYSNFRGGTDVSTQIAGAYWNGTGYVGRKYSQDAGRRIPLKLQYPGAGSYPSMWFAWDLPGATGINGVLSGIRGCENVTVPVGGSVVTENGMAGMPIYQAFRDLIDGTNGVSTNNPAWTEGDKTAYWDEDAGIPKYADGTALNVDHSARVFTVAIFNPEDMQSGKNSLRFVNFAKVFLEDPDVLYTNEPQKQQRPIVGRIMKFTVGAAGPVNGSLLKRIRLVQ